LYTALLSRSAFHAFEECDLDLGLLPTRRIDKCDNVLADACEFAALHLRLDKLTKVFWQLHKSKSPKPVRRLQREFN